MLLPSALPCDTRRPSIRSRLTPSRLFTTPPPSDDDFPSNNGLVGTCRALQSLLNGSPAPSPRRSKTPRLQSPLQIQPRPSARSRKQKQSEPSSIASPKPQRPRGANKRRRDSYEADLDAGGASFADAQTPPCNTRYSTPKRRRHVPYDLPLGLSQSDFYSLRSPPITQSPPSPAQRRKEESESKQETSASSFDPDAALPSIEETEEPTAQDTESWTSDDDQRLVELVLEKFQLSKRDWDDCARRMGKDNASVGRRWQALLGDGDVGLRRGRRMVRGRLNENWM
ncbi:hypothetical protein N8T08_005451 [Aspergillus melleus]|uniref:Uncharacterized protein n=1 Tax=Aspergillus melleus TaxID=138277 RepID=A0ACC3B2V1_9EURO|nr:hypothetical protein N8T08_005451 [Aspergillus melleus]